MSDPIQGYLDNMKKELLDAGELGPDEKLSGSELQNRYMKFTIKKAQDEMMGIKPKPKAPPTGTVPVPKSPPPEQGPSVVPKTKDTPETKMQSQYRGLLDTILVSQDKSKELSKQDQDLVLELLSSQDPVLAVEFLKLQAWLAKSVEEGLDPEKLTKEMKIKVEAVQKLFQKKLTRPEDLQKRFEQILPKLRSNNAAVENHHSKMAQGAKEMDVLFEKAAGGDMK
jgi:hypothetical protein